MGENSVKEISLGDDFGAVIVKLDGITVTINPRSGVDVYTSLPVGVHPALNSNVKGKAAPEIGDIERDGDHKGEIYGGTFPDGKPGWILEEPKPMTHYDAVELKGRALPTSKEGKYIDTIKDKGALKDIFARHSDGSSSAGYFWLAERYDDDARYQQFSDGSQYGNGYYRGSPLPVLSVRR